MELSDWPVNAIAIISYKFTTGTDNTSITIINAYQPLVQKSLIFVRFLGQNTFS